MRDSVVVMKCKVIVKKHMECSLENLQHWYKIASISQAYSLATNNAIKSV